MFFHKVIKEAQFHGAKRLADRNGSRLLWGLALTFLLFGAASVLARLVLRYLSRPTYLARLSSVLDVKPFPSVLVCPEVKFPDEKLDTFLENIVIPDQLNSSYMRLILPKLAAFYSPDMPYLTQDLVNLQSVLDINNLDVETATRNLTWSCEEMILKCLWRGAVTDCSTLFSMKVTGDGLCCVFNGRSLRSEIAKYGLHKVEPKLKWNTKYMGPFYGLMLIIDQSQRPDSIDLSYKWVALQHGQRYVDHSINGSALSPGYEHWFSYSSVGFRLSDDALKLNANMRRCRLKQETLEYFPIYAWKYCLLECEMAQTMRRCGCLKPTHPRPPGYHHCRALSLNCARHASVAASSSSYCQCPHTCDTDNDLIHTSSFPLHHNQRYDSFYDGFAFNNISVVRAYVESHHRKTFSRRTFFNYLDLFSQAGGIFNVYFGCSVLTIFELTVLFYYGIFKRRPLKKKKKKAAKRKLDSDLLFPFYK